LPPRVTPTLVTPLLGTRKHQELKAKGNIMDREFELYDFFSFLKFNEFYGFFSIEKKIGKNS